MQRGADPGETNTDMEIENVPWMQDVAKAAQHLTRLTLESSAQAALITRNNELWAYAGGLSQNAGKEIAQAVARNWDGEKGSDLLRFIRLESTRAEHMLYATRLGYNAILAMVFEAETPFSTIRMQANELVSAISTEKTGPAAAVAGAPGSRAISDAEMVSEEEEDELEIPPISEILTNIPSPNPPAAVASSSSQRHDPTLDETRVSIPLSNARSIPLRHLFMSKGRNEPDELALGDQRDAEHGEQVWRCHAEAGARAFFPFGGLVIIHREGNARAKLPHIAPGDEAADSDAIDRASRALGFAPIVPNSRFTLPRRASSMMVRASGLRVRPRRKSHSRSLMDSLSLQKPCRHQP